jgi:hypothetical protein
MGEVGALDEDDVDRVFSRALGDLERCMKAGAKRIELLGGEAAFYVKIDQSGNVAQAYLERSSVGDRTTEKCMLDVIRARSWPKPVGGETGIAKKSFDFDVINDVRPPAPLPASFADTVLAELDSKIASCKSGSSGTFSATVYVGAAGEVLGVGVTPPDEAGEARVDCLVEALSAAKFASPGSWPGKVSFSL